MVAFHTYRGVPIARVPSEDLIRCLAEGFQIHDCDNMTYDHAHASVEESIRIELLRRDLGLPVIERE